MFQVVVLFQNKESVYLNMCSIYNGQSQKHAGLKSVFSASKKLLF